MSKSFRSFDFDEEMMQHMFDMDAGYKGASTNTARRNRIKRMEELSHSLDDGLNYLGDEYGQAGGGGGGIGNGGQSGNRGGGRDNTRYNDEEEDDDDYDNDDYIDDYYYNNNKSFDGRPKSYNEKYSYMYNDYDGPNGRPKQENYRYSLNDPPVGKNLRYQQQSTSQQQQQQQQQQQKQFHSQPSTLRHKSSQGSSGNGTHGSSKHILFNDEDDICYVMDKKQSKSQQLQQQQQSPPPPPMKSKEKEKKKKEPLSPSSLFSSKKKVSKEELRYDIGKSDKSQQVMKAKLKIQNMSNDDSILNMRSNQKQNLLHRHHSVEAKLPSHVSDRSQMSPTILEEIEFEMQDVDCEKDDQVEEPIKEKEKVKEKSSSKDKKSNSDSAPSTPTIKKSFRSHLPNHKKLFKVPDIDLNHLKFSCFFSSNKNIALNSSKSTTASNTIANKTVSTEAIASKSSENLIEETIPTKVPDSPRKSVKIDLKNEKLERNDSQLSRETYKTHTRTNSGSRTMGSVSNIQSSNENVVDDVSINSSIISDKDFEVNVCVCWLV